MQSSSRNGASVRVLALHTTEGIMRARDLLAFFNRADATGSSHASADDTGALLGPGDGFVPYDRAAWTLRNGNPWSENLEMCAMASWTRPQWLSRPLLLEAAAQWLAERSKARGIPLRRLTVAECRAGLPGVIDHDTYTKAYQDGSHWDVGPHFPWDVVMPRAQQIAIGEDWFDMATKEELVSILRSEGISGAADTGRIVTALEEPTRAWVSQETAKVLRSEGVSGAADVVRMAEALTPALGAKLAAATAGSPAGTLSKADVEDALRSVFATVSRG